MPATSVQLALSVEAGRDDQLIFAQQLGADAVFVRMGAWDGAALQTARHRVEQTGLALAGVEGLDLAAPSASVQAALGAAARAGIPLVCGDAGLAQSAPEPVGRGQAGVALLAQPAPPDSAALARLVPDGVRLAVAGASRAPEPPLGLDLQTAFLSGPGMNDLTRLGQRVFSVQIGNRDMEHQAFLDEGEVDLPRLLHALHENGFEGPVRAAAPPAMEGDEPWGYKGRAYDLGYLRALLQTVRSL